MFIRFPKWWMFLKIHNITQPIFCRSRHPEFIAILLPQVFQTEVLRFPPPASGQGAPALPMRGQILGPQRVRNHGAAEAKFRQVRREPNVVVLAAGASCWRLQAFQHRTLHQKPQKMTKDGPSHHLRLQTGCRNAESIGIINVFSKFRDGKAKKWFHNGGPHMPPLLAG